MTMIHHDGRDYNTAASEAAVHFRAKMEGLFDKGRGNASRLVEHVMTKVPTDRIVPAVKLADRVKVVSEAQGEGAEVKPRLVIDFGDGQVQNLHNNALQQMATRAEMPLDFVREMSGRGAWGAEMIARNFREIFSHNPEDKYLLRSVDGDVRGVLSDKYRRLDNRVLLDTFVTAANALNLVPIDSTLTDTRIRLKMLLPLIFEPIPHEIMCFGLEWGNSDFGNGGHTTSVFVLRGACTNLATFENLFRQVHLGKRLSEDFQYSQQTYELDQAASASALNDTIKGALGPGVVNSYLDMLRTAGTEKVDTGVIVERLKKKLTKAEVSEVVETFNSAEIELLPAGNTSWRFSNALSLLAGRADDGEKKLNYERLAGEILPAVKKVPALAASVN